MRVAIAGYSDLAQYICEEFVKAGHDVLVLTRSRKARLKTQGVAQAVTDYSLSSLERPLADCDVLISTVYDTSSWYTVVHNNLILACQESQTCKRFIPAEFGPNIADYPKLPGFFFDTHEPVRKILRSQTDVEWTLVCIGWLSDYFVPSRNRYIKDMGDAHPLDWTHKKISIPGTGYEPVDFTWARDVAKGLISLAMAPRHTWQPYTFMSGERSCWNDTFKTVQRKFQLKFPVEHMTFHDIKEMTEKDNSENTQMRADFYLLSIGDGCANPLDKVQSQKETYFSGVHFRSLEDGLSQLDEDPDSIL